MPTTTPTATPPTTGRLTHQPAFDGLRGLAVIAVLLFHADFSWARGGFLGVSTFFTLSGFLITSLLLAEWDSVGDVSLRTFWGRRVRRLLPASVLTLVLVIVYATVVAGPSELASIRRDVFAAVGQVSNWWFIKEGRSYGALFRAPSIVQHYWSLAIEEQFYLVFPPLLVLALRRGWDTGKIAVAVVSGIVLSTLATVVISSGAASSDRIYFGTDTRAVELLIGVLLALLTARSRRLSYRMGNAVVATGSAGLLISIGLWLTAGPRDQWIFHGGLSLYALCSGAVVLACREPGPVRTVLSWAPLRFLGTISYGIYLLPWPIYQILTPQRLHVSLTLAFVLRVGVTVPAAMLSAILLELPVRRGVLSHPTARWAPPAMAVGALAVIVLAAAFVVPTSNLGFDIDSASAEFKSELSQQRPAIVGAPKVATFGDSTAKVLTFGLSRWSAQTGRIIVSARRAELGCGIVLSGEVHYGDSFNREGDTCHDRVSYYGRATRSLDVAVVMFGPWDLADHKLPGDDTWRHIGDPVFDRVLRADAEHLLSLLSQRGALVVWVLNPLVRPGTIDGRPPAKDFQAAEPERMRRLNDMIRAMAASHPFKMRTIDLAGYLRRQPGGEMDGRLRPDGIHFTRGTSTEVVTNWFGPELLKIVADAKK